jgi:hypothetical protein
LQAAETAEGKPKTMQKTAAVPGNPLCSTTDVFCPSPPAPAIMFAAGAAKGQNVP